MEAQLDELKTTYNQLCDSSTQQLQQLEQQLAKEEERKVDRFGWGGVGRAGRRVSADLWQTCILLMRA